jgi:uncharacterized membrane protein
MKKHGFAITLIILSLLSWAIAYPYLPAEVPTHWGINGEPNQYTSKLLAVFMLPGLLILLYGLMVGLPKIDPKKANYEKFQRGYAIIVNATLVFIFILNLITLFIGLGFNLSIPKIIPVLVGGLFLVMGNYMQQVKLNFFVGIRTPWTLSSDEIWRATHRVASKTMVVGGLIIMVSTFLPVNTAWVVVLGTALVSVFLPLGYSYWLYKKQQQKTPH